MCNLTRRERGTRHFWCFPIKSEKLRCQNTMVFCREAQETTRLLSNYFSHSNLFRWSFLKCQVFTALSLVIYTSAKVVFSFCVIPLPPHCRNLTQTHTCTFTMGPWKFLSLSKRSAIQLHADDRPASFYMHRDLGLGYILHSSVDSQHGVSVVVLPGHALYFTFSSTNTSRFVWMAGHERLIPGCPVCTAEQGHHIILLIWLQHNASPQTLQITGEVSNFLSNALSQEPEGDSETLKPVLMQYILLLLSPCGRPCCL